MTCKTADERLKVQTQRNTLSHRIRKWRTIQVLYMPIVTTFLAKDDDGDDSDAQNESDPPAILPENVRLWMPSEVPSDKRTAGLATGLVQKEERLRIAEADDALHQVCGRFHPELVR